MSVDGLNLFSHLYSLGWHDECGWLEYECGRWNDLVLYSMHLYSIIPCMLVIRLMMSVDGGS